MTERTGVVRIAACAGVLAALVAGVGCTGSHGMSNGPKGSTETGNPPVLDSGAVSLVVSEDAVHVIGEPGAVTPAEGTVEITVVRTGEKITGRVNADGSFDVLVDGTLDDVFEVRVVNGGRSSMTITVVRGGAMVEGPDASTMMPVPTAQCAELDMRVVNGAAMIIASVDTACERDADCTLVQLPQGCGSRCDPRYVSQLGKSQFEMGIAQVEQIDCADYAALGCMSQPSCILNVLPPECVAGTCRPQGSPSPCDGCDDFELRWTVISSGVSLADPTGETYTITGCDTLTTQSYDMRSCSRELPAVCGAMGPTWKEKLDALLADADVARAIAEGGTHGESGEYAGLTFEITVRGATFRFRSCGGQPNRMCEAPAGMLDLVAYLWELQFDHHCSVNDDCMSPFDPGPDDPTSSVYWHDPATSTCVQRSYGGTGGNNNRYWTLEDCQEKCPAPADADDCGPDRAFVGNRCVACGPIGCSGYSNRCLARCESDADCEDEAPFHGTCTDGLCGLNAYFCPL